jgi:protein-disulfide isomerase
MQNLPRQKPWFKTAAGTVFLSILGIVGIATVLFSFLIAYYLWQINYGDFEGLEQKYNSNFTVQDTLQNFESQLESGLDVNAVLRDHNPTFGSPDAPVTIVAFLHVKCVPSRETWSTFRQVMDKYDPVTNVVFKNLALDTNDPLVGIAPICAHEQGKFLDYYSRLFEETDFSKGALIGYARETGLDTNLFSSCLDNSSHNNKLHRDLQDAANLGLRGTPTFVINNKKVEGDIGIDEWSQLILNELSL